MFILTRRIGESIRIGANTAITVVHARGDRVRLGIDVPGEVPVQRAELFEQRESQDVDSKDTSRLP